MGARVAIVGAGTVSHQHVKGWKRAGARLAAVADIDQQRADKLARQAGASAVEDWREAVSDGRVDVVDICTPPAAHREIAVEALRHGKHVVCEKPLAGTLADCDRIVEAERESAGGRLTVVHQLRLAAPGRQLRRVVRGGRLGACRLAQVVRHDAPPRALVERGRWGGWSLAGGGVLMTKAIHELDLLLWLLGPVRRVRAVMGTGFWAIESEDQAVASIEFESGAMGSVVASGMPWGSRSEFEIIGERGRITWPIELRLWTVQCRAGGVAGRAFALCRRAAAGIARRLCPGRGGNGHAALFQRFLTAVREGHEPPVTATEGRRAVELCTAIYTAAITGEAVDLPLEPSSRFYTGIQPGDYRGAATGDEAHPEGAEATVA